MLTDLWIMTLFCLIYLSLCLPLLTSSSFLLLSSSLPHMYCKIKSIKFTLVYGPIFTLIRAGASFTNQMDHDSILCIDAWSCDFMYIHVHPLVLYIATHRKKHISTSLNLRKSFDGLVRAFPMVGSRVRNPRMQEISIVFSQ